MRAIKLTNNGDTIIEVLIAMAVVAMVLGGAFVATNHSLRNTRQAQERAEALKISEEQLEQLKVAVANNTNGVFGTSDFCLRAGVLYTTPNPVQCDVERTAGGIKYSVSIHYSNTADDTYTLTTQWNSVVGGGTDKLSVAYRLHR